MANPVGSDKSLLDRLNALKPSTVNLDGSSKPVSTAVTGSAKPVSREEGLSNQLKSLRARVEYTPTADLDDKAQSRTVERSSDSLRSATTINQESVAANDGDIDPLLAVDDDETLEELLADLGSDEQWLEEVAAEFSRSRDEEHQKVTALLEELGDSSRHDQNDSNHDEESGDDSDGEGMTQQTADVLAQAIDEAEWEKGNIPKELPSPAKVQSQPRTKETSRSKINTDPLGLPTVPKDLQDQSGISNLSDQDADFEAQITSRMAALKGLGSDDRSLPSAPTSDVDELGLPVAPTFAPEDQPLQGVYKRYGYTDEDAKTWCTVCLEDGAIRCIGCDDDIYCARCWKEMHVGPSAGYEERGHRWEKFVKGR